MDDKPILYKCFICNSQFQFGPHAYNGRAVNAWDIMVCTTCYNANHDGIVPATHQRLLDHLRSKGIEPKLNASGWIDWPR